MRRFVIVNDAQPTEFARYMAAAFHSKGYTKEADEYLAWFCVLPAEDPHTYGSLAEAVESQDTLRKEHDNPEINVYRLIRDDNYREIVSICNTVVEDIEGFVSGDWDGNREGWEATVEFLKKAIAKATG